MFHRDDEANVTPLPPGTAVVFAPSEYLMDITPGKKYVIFGLDGDGDEYFMDDAGERNFSACTGQGAFSEGDGESEGTYKVVKAN